MIVLSRPSNVQLPATKMLAAHVVEAGKALEVRSDPIPEVSDEGLLIKTLYAGVCHSDIHFIDDEIELGDGEVFRRRDLPDAPFKGIVLGHEICGKVVAVGSKTPDRCHVKVGDTVIVYPWRGCRACEACSMGFGNLCENNPDGSEDIGQGRHSGGYSTHVLVPEWDLAIRLPKNIPPTVGCMLPCSVLTSYSALLRVRPALDLAVRMRSRANLLVIGAGGLGFWTVIIIKSLFGDKNVTVVVADINQDKLTEVSNIGADDAVLWQPNDDIETLVSKTTVSGYNKIDAAIDYVGSPTTAQVGLRSLHHGGTLVTIGLHGGALSLAIPIIVSRSLSVQGIRMGPKEALQELVDLFSVQDIQTLPPLEYYKLDDINKALDDLRAGKIKARALIKFTE